MPREGTETLLLPVPNYLILPFGNKMPREGTETKVQIITILCILFGNKMPREGTETMNHILKEIRH